MVILFNNNYCKLILNVFQEYAYTNIKDFIFWKAIHIDFNHWTKQNQETINNNT